MYQKITYKKEAIKIAKQIGYDISVINKIKRAKDAHEVSRIMVDARRKFFNMDTEF